MRPKICTALVVLLIPLLSLLPVQAQTQPETFPPITAANINNLRLLFVTDGRCLDVTQDGSQIITQTYVPQRSGGSSIQVTAHALPSGTPEFSVQGGDFDQTSLSSDDALLALNNSVYAMNSGKMLFSGALGSNIGFSADGSYAAVMGDGVYETKTWKRVFPLSSNDFVFSPDGKRIAVAYDGVYNVSTGEKLLSLEPPTAPTPVELLAFSPDSKLLAISNDGVYDLNTGLRRFSISGSIRANDFSPDNSLLVVAGDGVYSVQTGKRLYPIEGISNEVFATIHFSPDSAFFSVNEVGIYVTKTGRLIDPVTWDIWGFTSDSSLYSYYSNLLDVQTGTRKFNGLLPPNDADFEADGKYLVSQYAPCFVFAVSDIAPRGAVEIPANVNIRYSPSTKAPIVKVPTASSIQFVYARTQNRAWYKLGDRQWISAYAVKTLYLPDTLPLS